MTTCDDISGAIADIELSVRAAHEHAQRIAEAQGRMARVRGTATAGVVVTAVVDVQGRLIDLVIRQSGMTRPARDIARLVLDATERARRDAARQALTIAADVYGVDSATYRQLDAELSVTSA